MEKPLRKRGEEMKYHKVLKFPVKKVEEAEDLNCEAILEGVKEHKDLFAIRSLFVAIDKRNGIIGDEPMINHGMRVIDSAIERNEKQINHDRREQVIFDEVSKPSNVIVLKEKKESKIA